MAWLGSKKSQNSAAAFLSARLLPIGVSTFALAVGTAVHTEPVRDGLSGNLISISGVSENDLAVQTGAYVNKPRNRHVEITVQVPGI